MLVAVFGKNDAKQALNDEVILLGKQGLRHEVIQEVKWESRGAIRCVTVAAKGEVNEVV